MISNVVTTQVNIMLWVAGYPVSAANFREREIEKKGKSMQKESFVRTGQTERTGSCRCKWKAKV